MSAADELYDRLASGYVSRSRIEQVVAAHWLVFGLRPDGERSVTECACGYEASPDDNGYGDSIVKHLIELGTRIGAGEGRIK